MNARDAALRDLQAQIGRSYGPSRWITVDQPMIDQFAETTRDDQFIHVDPDRAAQTPLGGTIAQGFLTLSLASRFSYDCFEDLPGQHMGINYGFDRLRFLAPVRAGARVRGHFTLTGAAARDTAAILRTVALRIEIEGHDKPALAADWLTLILFDTP
ncbi:MAG: MaoC family dehydratase [Pseudomonadota bacterium]